MQFLLLLGLKALAKQMGKQAGGYIIAYIFGDSDADTAQKLDDILSGQNKIIDNLKQIELKIDRKDYQNSLDKFYNISNRFLQIIDAIESDESKKDNYKLEIHSMHNFLMPNKKDSFADLSNEISQKLLGVTMPDFLYKPALEKDYKFSNSPDAFANAYGHNLLKSGLSLDDYINEMSQLLAVAMVHFSHISALMQKIYALLAKIEKDEIQDINKLNHQFFLGSGLAGMLKSYFELGIRNTCPEAFDFHTNLYELKNKSIVGIIKEEGNRILECDPSKKCQIEIWQDKEKSKIYADYGWDNLPIDMDNLHRQWEIKTIEKSSIKYLSIRSLTGNYYLGIEKCIEIHPGISYGPASQSPCDEIGTVNDCNDDLALWIPFVYREKIGNKLYFLLSNLRQSKTYPLTSALDGRTNVASWERGKRQIYTGKLEADNSHQRWFFASRKELNILHTDECLRPGESLISINGKYSLCYQEDANLILWRNEKDHQRTLLWESKTQGKPAWRCYMQDDGNFVVYAGKGKSVWASNTNNKDLASSKLILENNGKLSIYDRNDCCISVIAHD